MEDCIQHLDVLPFDDIIASSTSLKEEFLKVIRAVHLFVIQMKINSGTDLMITDCASEAIQVIFPI
jgi:hypothetical protein